MKTYPDEYYVEWEKLYQQYVEDCYEAAVVWFDNREKKLAAMEVAGSKLSAASGELSRRYEKIEIHERVERENPQDTGDSDGFLERDGFTDADADSNPNEDSLHHS